MQNIVCPVQCSPERNRIGSLRPEEEREAKKAYLLEHSRWWGEAASEVRAGEDEDGGPGCLGPNSPDNPRRPSNYLPDQKDRDFPNPLLCLARSLLPGRRGRRIGPCSAGCSCWRLASCDGGVGIWIWIWIGIAIGDLDGQGNGAVAIGDPDGQENGAAIGDPNG